MAGYRPLMHCIQKRWRQGSERLVQLGLRRAPRLFPRERACYSKMPYLVKVFALSSRCFLNATPLALLLAIGFECVEVSLTSYMYNFLRLSSAFNGPPILSPTMLCTTAVPHRPARPTGRFTRMSARPAPSSPCPRRNRKINSWAGPPGRIGRGPSGF